MKTRIITAVVSLCLFVPVLIFSDTVAFPLVLALCSLLAVYEMTSCLGLKNRWAVVLPLYLLAAGFPFLIRYGAERELIGKAALSADTSFFRRAAWNTE